MTDAGDAPGSSTTVEPDPDAPPPTRSQAAITAYQRRMRPLRIIYAAAIVAVVVIALVLVKIAYSHGEISHVTLHTVAKGPSAVKQATTSTTLTRAWTSTDHTAIGSPLAAGTIVTYDAHTMRGRNAVTGAPTWSYTRTDRTLCTAMQTAGVAIAVYRLHGNCDELTAVDASTGDRRWTRTLDKDTAEFDGPASFQVGDGNLLFVSSTSVYSIAPGGDEDTGNGGLDYWTFHHPGCTIDGAVLGSAGALIAQHCSGQQCSGHKLCGNGPQLLLRNATAKYDDNSSTNKNNPDQIIWNDFGVSLLPTSAGQTVTAREPAGNAMHEFDVAHGRQLRTLPLRTGGPNAVSATSDADLIWLGGRTYALPGDASDFRWEANTVGPVTVTDLIAPALASATLLAPTTDGAVALNPATGTLKTSYRVPTPARSMVYPVGSGLLVAGETTTVYR